MQKQQQQQMSTSTTFFTQKLTQNESVLNLKHEIYNFQKKAGKKESVTLHMVMSFRFNIKGTIHERIKLSIN